MVRFIIFKNMISITFSLICLSNPSSNLGSNGSSVLATLQSQYTTNPMVQRLSNHKRPPRGWSFIHETSSRYIFAERLP